MSERNHEPTVRCLLQKVSQLSSRTPEQLVQDAATALAHAAGGSCHIDWHETTASPAFIPAGSVPIPVKWADRQQATVHWLPPAPALARPADINSLKNIISRQAQALLNHLLLQATAVLREALVPGSTLQEAIAATLTAAMEVLEVHAGIVLLRTAAGLEELVSKGCPNELAPLRKHAKNSPEHIRQGTVLMPEQHLLRVSLMLSTPARCVLLLQMPTAAGAAGTAEAILQELAKVTAPEFMYRYRELIYQELLELNQMTGEIPTEELYDIVLRKAVDLIPGANSGSLLTRSTPDSDFTCRSLHGFGAEPTKGKTAREAAVRAWYGTDCNGWRHGQPRILQNTNKPGPHAAGTHEGFRKADVFQQVMSSLCLPVLLDGDVMAVLNLDNTVTEDAFSTDSKHAILLFGAPLASLLHRQHAQDALHQAARTDQLTGLLNRRALQEALERETSRAARGGTGPTVLFMDMQDFKEINDGHGHAAGDELLIRIARKLQQSLRQHDLPGRYGGDEFVAVLPETTLTEAEHVARRIKRNINNITTNDRQLGVSIGAASHDEDSNDPAELLQIADARMYADKLASATANDVPRTAKLIREPWQT